MIEQVIIGDVLHATIVRRTYHEPGIRFFTPTSFSQQLGYFSHPSGHRIQPHTHRQGGGAVYFTQEVLVLRKGRLRVDFYTDSGHFLESRTLEEGDVILLVRGGHGFEVLEACEVVEVRQGPYVGADSKIRFDPVDDPADAGR